jgi:glycosyltransferase involved in cell wall biosynthesis
MKKINLNVPINGTGYGITSTNITLNLDLLDNLEVSLFPIGNNIALQEQHHQPILTNLIKNSRSFEYTAPSLKIWHQHDLASRIGKGDYYVMPFFEIDTLPEYEIHQINSADAVFTPTHWSKTILETNGVRIPIYVCPLGVDEDIFKTRTGLIPIKQNYTFIHIGKWEKRKSQDFLIKAFETAFTKDDDVELRLVPFNPFLNKEETEQWLQHVKKSPLKDKIKIYDRLPSQYDLANVISESDCGVYLSRAEGWNNEIPETMIMNKPVIVTNYSAHTEYCNSENSYLVDIDELEPAYDGKWFNGSGNWAKLGEKQLEQTVEHMRFVYNNRVETNPAGVSTGRKYSWSNTVSVIDYTLTARGSY